MKKVIYVMMGVAGVGKSTYINNHKSDNSVILSSDAIRMELFGTLENQTNDHHKIVFQTMEERLRAFLEDTTHTECFYDATNLNRRNRMNLFNKFADKAEFVILFLAAPLAIIKEQNAKRSGFARVPEEVIEQMYKNIQVPRVGVDCHRFEVIVNPEHKTAIKAEMSNNGVDVEHDSPWHEETIFEHVIMCLLEVSKNNEHQQLLYEIAAYHDTGKFVCREYCPEKGYHRYLNHANVSAMQYLMDNPNTFNHNVLEVIYQHIQAHNGITSKAIKRYKLTELELELIEKFSEIDNYARVVRSKVRE